MILLGVLFGGPRLKLAAWISVLAFSLVSLRAYNRHETLGPSSRKTPIVISEIMYKPAARADLANLEFVEIYNSNPFFHDISGYRLTAGKMNYTFPQGTIIPANAFFVIAASPSDMARIHGLTNVFGPYIGSLKRSETLQLLDEVGSILLTVPYSNLNPWPVAADGTGHSLILANPSYGEGDPRAWDVSDLPGGSPGANEVFVSIPSRDVVINEILAHTEDGSARPFIELYNHSPSANDVSGCIMADDTGTNRFVIPPGTVISPGGFISFDQSQLGFDLNASGETIFFLDPTGSRVFDAVQFEAQADRISVGRWPDGASVFYPLASATPGSGNTSPSSGDIVINELMYAPISRDDDDQFIELYNKGTSTIRLADWRFTEGITFTFPTNATIAPDSYLVVARNRTNLWAKYPNLSSVNTIGNYSGKLSHNGARLALAAPQLLTSKNAQAVITNTIYVVQDEVSYGTGGRWGQWSSGGGSSLELTDPRSNHRLAANWADSDDTDKSAWVNIESTGVLDNGNNYESSILHAQIGLLDVGECLFDNIEVVPASTGVNLVTNPDFENGLSGWSLQGCFFRSSVENNGYQSSHSLHARCSDRLWTGDNSCQVTLSPSSLGAGQTATLRFKARWLHGWPEALLRLNGNWLEATGALPVPGNLGTPGARNSRYAGNAGPAVYDVTHTPPIPAANQSVVVTARAHDVDGIRNLTVNYRIDPSYSYTAVAMHDDGINGDALAGDGVFSAMIPGQASSRIAAFYILATDNQFATARFPALANDNAPAPECNILFGDSTTENIFGVYHLWVTQTNVTRWSALSDLSNEAHDSTFVTGSRVIYNAKGRFAGSPYHQQFDTPYGNPCHYKWIFPEDDKFLGATSFNKIHQPGNSAGDDTTNQREQLANLFLRTLGVPWLNRRYVAVYVNGRRRGTLMEDAQVPDGDVIKERYPNDKDGFLYKMQPWFEFAPSPTAPSIGFNNAAWCALMPYTTTGGQKKVARYRNNFLVRRTPDSASNFTPVFALVDAANSFGTPNYVSNMESMADMENWMRVFAANHASGNWDSFGAQNAQNLYGYMGTQGTKYSLHMWDFNIVFGNSGSWGPGANLFAVNGADPNTTRIYQEPTFRRMYWRALQELVNGPLNPANSGPLMDAKFAAFSASGVSVTSPATIKSWIASAGPSIASQIAAENVASFTVNPNVAVANGVAHVTGTAPFVVKTVRLNDVEWPLTWKTVTAWDIAVPLQQGSNVFQVAGVGMKGQVINGMTNSVTVVYTGSGTSPVGKVVINEIMSHPAIPGADYIELFNSSTDVAFDLSGYQIPELFYTFPSGTSLRANGYLILAENRAAFTAAYAAAGPIFGTYNGSLNVNGQTLSLLAPASGANPGVVVAKVRYEGAAPWPSASSDLGASLQLIDPTQDMSRAGNWAVVTTNSAVPPAQWQYVTLTGIATKSTLLIGMKSDGDVYLDDMKLVAGSIPEAGANLIQNGDFEGNLTNSWTVSPNMANSEISSFAAHSGNSSLHVVATSGGDTIALAIWQNTATITTNATYTLSYWYLPSAHGTSLLLRLAGSGPNLGQIYSLQPFQPPPINSTTFTPGAVNSVKGILPAFPSLWINEVQPDNLTGITNSAGQPAPWLELYNSGTNVLSLSDFYLANSYSNLLGWQFPLGSVINPGEYKVVFADGQKNLSSLSELHTDFVLSLQGGSIALSRANSGTPQIIDYMNYPSVAPDGSYGSDPAGQDFAQRQFSLGTPGVPNKGAVGAIGISINEWLASNTNGLANPIGGQLDDWFELYNSGNTSVDLAGYYLSDTATNKVKFQIPSGYIIRPQGFLLVWADKQAATGGGDLHVNFRLNKAGTSIGLFAPDGGTIDYVTFGVQTTDLSQGRYPDGASQINFMTPTPRARNAASINTSPRLSAAIQNGTTVRVKWPSVAGTSYRLEFTDDLNATAWTSITPDQSGTGSDISMDLSISASSHRFYRVVLLQ